MIVVAGENLIDFIQTGDVSTAAVNPGYEAAPGGSPYNCAMALGRLGMAPGYLGVISSDVLGTLLRGRLEATGAGMLIPEPSPAPSSLAVVNTDEKGSPAYRFYRSGTAERDISVARLSGALPATPTLFQTGSLSLTIDKDAAIWEAAAREAVARGALFTLDPNVRPLCVGDWTAYRARMASLFGLAALVKISDEDLQHLDLGVDNAFIRQHFFEKHGCSMVVVTRGDQGSILLTPQAEAKVSSYRPPTIVDTVGAGDTFMAGLLAEICNRGVASPARLAALTADELAEIGRFAAVAAGLNCAEKGCNPPSADAVRQILSTTGPNPSTG